MLFLISVFFLSFSLEAKNIYEFSNENLEKDFIELSQEVSCPLCAGSSIAESDSDIANDLKNAIFIELENGKTPKEIKNNLIKLYGEGILFMPENKISILILYGFPLLLIGIGIFFLFNFSKATHPRPGAPLEGPLETGFWRVLWSTGKTTLKTTIWGNLGSRQRGEYTRNFF